MCCSYCRPSPDMQGDPVCACLQHGAVRVRPLQWSRVFQDLCVCVCVCVHVLPLPSFLSLFRPARSVRLPAEHSAAKYTHISKHSTTTDRVLSQGREVLGIGAKGRIEKD